jgi:phosphoribosylcarboxyaminoimidazole (NCAIR) mutase
MSKEVKILSIVSAQRNQAMDAVAMLAAERDDIAARLDAVEERQANAYALLLMCRQSEQINDAQWEAQLAADEVFAAWVRSNA